MFFAVIGFKHFGKKIQNVLLEIYRDESIGGNTKIYDNDPFSTISLHLMYMGLFAPIILFIQNIQSMKNILTLLLSVCVILLILSACGESPLNGGSSDPTQEKVADILNIQQGAGLVYRKALKETNDIASAPLAAFIKKVSFLCLDLKSLFSSKTLWPSVLTSILMFSRNSSISA
ncbi:MAG: hypothetical protein U5K72_04655 [Balneolaceae bacterium]|nr:hypothetical protein [Balneolaceae bacterium]